MNALDLLTKNDNGTYSPKFERGNRMLFAGKSGEGKSNAEVSFPGPIYVFDCDNRFKGATSACSWLGIERFKQIDFDFYNPNDGFKKLDEKLNILANDAVSRKCKFNTIVFDSIGSMCAMLGLDAIKMKGGAKVKSIGDVKFLGPEEYNYISTAFRLLMFNYIFTLNKAGINTIFSAWIVDRYGKKPSTPDYAPAEIIGEKIMGTGNMIAETMGYFNEVFQFRKENSPLYGKPPIYTVEYNNGDIAKNSLNLPLGKFDITSKSFYDEWLRECKKVGIYGTPTTLVEK